MKSLVILLGVCALVCITYAAQPNYKKLLAKLSLPIAQSQDEDVHTVIQALTQAFLQDLPERARMLTVAKRHPNYFPG